MNTDEFQTHVVTELAKLTTHMTWLVGNGQPGKIATMEAKISQTADEVLQTKSFTRGVSLTLSILWVVATAILTYWHFHPIYGTLLQQLNNQNH